MPLSSRVFLAAFAVLFIAACHRRPPVASTPQPVVTIPQPAPAPPSTEAAVREFAAGDYEAAALDFEEYLNAVASGGQRDEALFYSGLIYARQNWQKASGYFDQLLAEFPQSKLTPAAQIIVSAKQETAQLSVEVQRLKTDADQYRKQAEELRNNSVQLHEQVALLTTKADQLTQEAERKDQRINQLKTELERLTKIDLGNRPRR